MRKGEKVLQKIREGWATVPDLLDLTGWSHNTLRGFISSSAKKFGLKVERSRDGGVTSYRVVKG